MKGELQGPFLGVRWFCADGTILPPREYACRDRGGGRQFGQRGARAETIRAAGIPIANVLAELTPESALAEDAQLLKGVLVEQFLVAADDGWILRRARYVRGMFQAEDEAAAARRILLELARDPRVPGPRFTLLRESVRLLPRRFATGSFGEVRALADELALRDPGFVGLRNLIHSRPDPALAARVRAHAVASASGELRAQFEKLAADLDAAFAHTVLAGQLDRAATSLGDTQMQRLAARYRGATDPQVQLAALAEILVRIRDATAGYSPSRRLLAMELSLAAEEAAFAASRVLLSAPGDSRRTLLQSLVPLVDGLYGCGLVTQRERQTLLQAMQSLAARDAVTAGEYRDILDVLGRVPSWASNRLTFHLGPMIRSFARVDPQAHALIPDRLHASLLLAYSERLEYLAADGDRQAGVAHMLFGAPVASGLRALNPGLARGVLMRLHEARASGATGAIVLAAETTADLPPVAGILTESEGNSLSHVQLLARNLGLPNVVVGRQHQAALNAQTGTPVVLAASPAGVVHIARDGPHWDAWFPQSVVKPVAVGIDMDRLDLSLSDPVALTQLRAGDAGRIVGPKAAHLGELSTRYPGMVSPGIAIPFGAFRSVLDRPAPDGSGPMFDWLRTRYRALAQIDDPARRGAARRALLDTTRAWFAAVELPDGFVERLRAAAEASFGSDGSYGVYVRSDTNLEDLPGFTGAGLNRTVPNVVGFDRILDAIRTVWASVFTERAYGWRQAVMEHPEHVYASVLLHRTIASDKSGVLVTTDPLRAMDDTVFIAANEGPGGGVDGQTAESLRLSLAGLRVDLVASATEPTRRETLAGGGLREVPASGHATLLTTAELRQLAELAATIPERYPQLRDAQGQPAPADVEFAFADGRLYLLQIRPFLQNPRAQRNAFLLSLDTGLAQGRQATVKLDEAP